MQPIHGRLGPSYFVARSLGRPAFRMHDARNCRRPPDRAPFAFDVHGRSYRCARVRTGILRDEADQKLTGPH